MAAELRFAVAGTPLSTKGAGGTVAGLHRAHELGISAMEIEWVQMVPKSPERMVEIREAAEKLDIALTVHAPYYVNLNSAEPAKLAASIQRVIAALSMAQLCGARSVCVHPAFYQGNPPNKVYDRVKRATEVILKNRKSLFPDVNLAYETMGKPTQFGTLEEVLRLSKEFDMFPCVDPAHMHARTNGLINTAKEWNDMFDAYEKALGKKSLQHVHMHYSGIAYTVKGERYHEPLQESDARWKDFLKVLKNRSIAGNVVCESPLLEVDTLLMQRTYQKLR